MQHRIVVLGAGYAGAIAAGRLARRLHRDDVDITLVNAEPDFVERVRMHQLATGQDLQPRPLREMFAGTGVELRVARVTARRRRRAGPSPSSTPTAPRNCGYDTLVYALGSALATTTASPASPSTPTRSPAGPGALRLRERLAGLAAGRDAWSSSAAG